MRVARRVVTEVVEGRSRVAIDDEAPRTWCDEIWVAGPDQPLGCDPGDEARPVQATPGTTAFRIATVPPDEVVRAALAERRDASVQADGFHRTQTIDYVMVLDGPVELELDDGSVLLQPGDCVVQRETNHAWRNHGTEPIRLLVVMVGTP